MGQGTFTTLPLIIAEELDADWAKVKPILPPAWDEKNFGNPDNGGTSRRRRAPRCTATSSRCASRARRRGACCSTPSRRNGTCRSASFRPSRAWSCTRPPAAASSYGEIAAFAKAPAEMPKIEDKDLKAAGELPPHRQGRAARRGADQGHRRREIRDGRAGARHGLRGGAAIALFGAAPQTVDDAAARKVPGITDVVRLPDGVGVIGTTVEGTQAAKNLLKVTWSDAPGANHDSERALEEFAAIGRDKSRAGVALREAATPRPPWRAPPRCSAANTARATSITPRWSR